MLNEISQPLWQAPRLGGLLAGLWSLARIGAVRCQDGAFFVASLLGGQPLFYEYCNPKQTAVRSLFPRVLSQHRFSECLTKEIDVIQDELPTNNSRAGTRCLGTRSPTAYRGIEMGADTWTRFRTRCLPGSGPSLMNSMASVNPFLCKLNIESVYPTLPITDGMATI